MLKTLSSTRDAVFHRLSLKASISTNTAINKSLRRAQRGSDKGQRRPLRNRSATELKSQYPARPPFRVEGLNQRQKFAGRRKEPSFVCTRERTRQRSNPSALDDVVENSISEESGRGSGAQYDYSPKPGGNRLARRAIKFGHIAEPKSESSLSRSKYVTEDRTRIRRWTDSRTIGEINNSESALSASSNNPELSLPEELQHDYGRSSSSVRHSRARVEPIALRERRLSRPRLGGSPTSRSAQNSSEKIASGEIHNPLSIPYTTPASEFLYGTSVVVAALLSSRRKFYKLYIDDGENTGSHEQDFEIRRLALKRGVVVERVAADRRRLMDKMSTGRPHNGYVLEASPLPRLPVTGFQHVKSPQGSFDVIMGHQSREDEEVNGKDENIKYEGSFSRYPFVLLLDGILDPGNLGAILRSAFFLGVDAVAICNRSSASLSPVALKASAGASESLPLISIDQPGSFLDVCKNNGWKVYGATAATADNPQKYFSTTTLGSPLQDHACIVILGNEGQGLRWNIQRKADYDVGVEGPRRGQGKVDSLNVSVAAGLLCEAFLRKPISAGKVSNQDNGEIAEQEPRATDDENKLF